MVRRPELKAAVIGAGMLGIDLAERIDASRLLTCALVAGRRGTTGLRLAARRGGATSTDGIHAVTDEIDVVFDASNAVAHPAHRASLSSGDVLSVDLTPGGTGAVVVSTINGSLAETSRNIGMVSCGGQAALPLLHAIAEHCAMEYVEVVTTVASASVGRATRSNLDEYLDVSEAAVREFTRTPHVKFLANISPALPAPAFRVQVTAVAREIRRERVHTAVAAAAEAVRVFAPGYTVTPARRTTGA